MSDKRKLQMGTFADLTGRRNFLMLLASALWPDIAQAQDRPSFRVAVLGSAAATDTYSRDELSWLTEGLQLVGWRENQDYVFLTAYVDGDYTHFPRITQELVLRHPDVIVAFTLSAVQAAQSVSKTLPIVMTANDPVGAGLISSLSRPGGNVTGIATMNEDLTLKAFELTREILPNFTRVAALLNPRNPSSGRMLAALRTVAASGGVSVQAIEVPTPETMDTAFDFVASGRPDVLFIIPDTALVALTASIAERAAIHRIPIVGTFREQAKAGALITYGRVRRATVYQMAIYIRRIADGAKPADLPVEQPRSFEISINTKMARVLGVTIPSSLLARADEVIE